MGTGLHKMDMFAEKETETGNDYKCKHCETTRPPTETKEDGRTYLFCSVCKNELAEETPTENLKEGIEIDIFHDTDKKYVIMTVEDWAKIVKVFEDADCETSLEKK